MNNPKVEIVERHDRKFGGGWYARTNVGGIPYFVGVEAGKRVRIPYKPRGPQGWGHHWHGFVRNAQGSTVWSGRVNKSTGVRGLLRFAGILITATNENEV